MTYPRVRGCFAITRFVTPFPVHAAAAFITRAVTEPVEAMVQIADNRP